MQRFGRSILLAAMLALLNACNVSEHKEVVTLNPDGSDKTELEIFFDPLPGQPADPAAVRDQAASHVLAVVQGAVGVDAWSDVAYEILPDERVRFLGTAYFKKLSDFHLDTGLGLTLDAVWAKADDGRMSLALESKPGQKVDMTDQQVARQQVQQCRVAWGRYTNEILRSGRGTRRSVVIDVTYLLPGKVEQAVGFKSVPGGAQLAQSADRVLAPLSRFMYQVDDAALRNAIASGHMTNGVPDQETVARAVYGLKPVVTVGGALKPLFDYQAQSAAARKAWPANLQRIKNGGGAMLELPLVPTPAP